MASIARLLVFLAGGLAVSVVGERMRRTRIRERRQGQELADANAALRVSEEKYRFLVENSKDITWTIDLQGTWTFISGNVEKVTGYRVDEIIGKTLWDFLAPECHDLVEDRLRRRVRGEDLPPYEVLVVGKDGRHTPFELLTASIVDGDGNIVGVQGVSRDVTERKRARDALQFTQFAVDHTADAAFWMTEDAKLFYVNEAACQALGYSREELLQMTVFDIDPAFTQSMWLENRRKLKAEKSIVLETVHRARDGRIYPVDIRANYLEFGGREYDCAFARDITDRKRAEEALRRNLAVLAKSQEIAHMGNWTVDLGTWEFEASDEDLRIYGFEPGAVVSMDQVLAMIHPDDLERYKEYVEAILRGGPLGGIDYRIVWPDGSLHYVHALTDSVVRGPDGRLKTASGITQDITERKQAEEAVAESRKRYRGLVEKINDWVWEIDADGVYTYVSPRALELLGYRPEEIVGKTPFDFMPPAEVQRVRNAFQPIWLERKPLELLENTLVRKDGRLVTVETSGMPVFAEDGAFLGYTGVDRDVTDAQAGRGGSARERGTLPNHGRRFPEPYLGDKCRR